MRRDEVIARLKSTESTLKELGVAHLYLFGSHARDAAQPTSDVDVFIVPDARQKFGFAPFMDVYETLRRAVGDRLDYGTLDGVHPHIRDAVEKQAVLVF